MVSGSVSAEELSVSVWAAEVVLVWVLPHPFNNIAAVMAAIAAVVINLFLIIKIFLLSFAFLFFIYDSNG